ncbi:MAG: oligosaccharide flippase family protein [Pseudomonadota bacterium]
MSPASRAVGTFWAVIERLGQRFFGFVFVILIARFAGPESFGVVAPVLVYFFFFEQCILNVLRRRLILVEDLSREDHAFCLALAYGLATVGLGLCLTVAAAIHWAEGDAQFAELLVLGCVLTFIKASASPHHAQLMRDFKFRYIAMVSVLATLCGGGLGLWLAQAGYGPYAVLAYQGVTFLVEAIGLAFAARGVMVPRLPRGQWARHRKFLRPIFVSETMFFVGGRSEVMVLVFFLSEAALGSYFLARRYIDTVAEILNSSLANIAFSTYSRADSDEALADARSFFLMVAMSLALPSFLGLMTIAPEVVQLTLGPQWAEAEGLLTLLCLLGIPFAAGRVAMAFLIATEAYRPVLILSRLSLVVNLGSIVAAASFGVVAVIWALILSHGVMAALGMRYVAQRVAFRQNDLWRSAAAPGLATAAMVAAIELLPAMGGAAATVGASIAVGAAVYAAAIVVLNPSLTHALSRRVASGTPAE